MKVKRVGGGLVEVLQVGTFSVELTRDTPTEVPDDIAEALLLDGTGRFEVA